MVQVIKINDRCLFLCIFKNQMWRASVNFAMSLHLEQLSFHSAKLEYK